MGVCGLDYAVYLELRRSTEALIGCLILVILAFLFRGAILALLAWLFAAVVALFTFLLSLGFWGIILIVVLLALAAAFK